MVTGAEPRAQAGTLHGLGDADVAARVAAGAVNVVPSGPTRTVGEIVKANVVTLFNILLGVMLVVVLIVAPFQDAMFGLVLVGNAAIGIIQELRAKRTLDRLALLSAPRAAVIRNGREAEVPVDRVVLDDLLTLKAGDQVVVDGVVVVSDSLEVNESLLTGESDPILKDRGDEVLSGSFVSSGSGVYKARRVGADAYAARLAEEARKFTLVRSELRAGIDKILRGITWVLVPTALLLIWSQFTTLTGWPDSQGWGWADVKEAIRLSIAGLVAMIPQGLVLLTSVAFAVGVIRLGRRQVLVQELPAVEGLARVDTVCFDKTGTLTEGRLVVDQVDLLTDRYDVRAALGALGAADPNPNATLQAITEQFPEPSGWWPVATVPFSSARKWSGASFGSLGSWILGAPEMILPDHPAVADRVAAAADQGKRVLLLAHSAAELTDDRLPAGVEPVALLSLSDRVRPDAVDTLRYFARQGVTAKVISGDHPQTVAAIAREVGIEGADRVVDARTLPEDPAELAEAVDRGTVFGRVTPHQKRAMVGALQSRGHVVAMTGDGVNDVLALKDADIGIAMGSGSSASRAVAQLVLLDGSFATLPSVVGEGRRVIANIERVANLFVVKTVYAFLLAVLVGLFSRPFPFVPRHLTLVGTLTIGAPAFFIALAPTADRARSGFVARVLRFAFPVGALAAASSYIAYELAISEKVSLIESRTTATLVLFAVGLFALVINARPLTTPRKWLIGVMTAGFLLVLFLPFGREFFELDLPRAVVMLAGVGIVGLAGSVMYGSLRSLGVIQRVPQLLRDPQLSRSALGALRSGMERMRERARKVGQPMDPADLPDPPPPPAERR
ncbi:MAG: HAD-IC family P-type ATPase [Actinobacteria bacterium]|nr:HAD-IC family P-type ATPase [Actinomycetota bacterium]